MKGYEFANRMHETENGCDKNCNKCALYLTKKNKCFYKDLKDYEVWAKKRSIEFRKSLEVDNEL